MNSDVRGGLRRVLGVSFFLWLLYPAFVYVPVYLKSKGFSPREIGIAASVLYLIGFIFSGPAGVLADFFSVRRLSSIGFFFFGAFPFLLSRAVNLFHMVGAYFVGAVGNTLVRMSTDAFFLKFAPRNQEFRTYGYVTGIGGLGMAVGYVIFGFVVKGGGFERFLYAVVTATLPGLFLSFFLPSVKLSPERPQYVGHMRSFTFIAFSIALFLHTSHFGAEVTSLGLFLMKELGFSGDKMGLVMGVAMLFLAGGGFLGGWMGPRVKKGKVLMTAGLFISGAGNVFFSLSSTPYSVLFFRLVHEIGDAFIFVGMRVIASRVFPPEELGGIWGGLRTAITLASFTGSIVYGWVAQISDFKTPFFVAGFVSFISPFFILSLKEESKRNRS